MASRVVVDLGSKASSVGLGNDELTKRTVTGNILLKAHAKKKTFESN